MRCCLVVQTVTVLARDGEECGSINIPGLGLLPGGAAMRRRRSGTDELDVLENAKPLTRGAVLCLELIVTKRSPSWLPVRFADAGYRYGSDPQASATLNVLARLASD